MTFPTVFRRKTCTAVALSRRWLTATVSLDAPLTEQDLLYDLDPGWLAWGDSLEQD
jgi:hypothetical protein